MTVKTERPSFRGVACLHCQAPIPIPAIVHDNQVALLQEAGASRQNSPVFNVRCPACHKEKPYRTSEIVSFDGFPQQVSPFAEPALIRTLSMSLNSRAAKA